MKTENNISAGARTQQWRLWEDIDGCSIFPANCDPDDLAFGRVKPLAKFLDSPESTPIIQYLSKLPAFRSKPSRRQSKAMRLQREHEHQSNLDSVKDGSYIKGYNQTPACKVCGY